MSFLLELKIIIICGMWSTKVLARSTQIICHGFVVGRCLICSMDRMNTSIFFIGSKFYGVDKYKMKICIIQNEDLQTDVLVSFQLSLPIFWGTSLKIVPQVSFIYGSMI